MTARACCATVTRSQAHCPTCHRTFGGPSGFDTHRKDGKCVDPATLGMRQRGDRVWVTPMTEAAAERLASRGVTITKEHDDTRILVRVNPDHPHTDPGDGRTECQRCGKWVFPVTHSCKGIPVTDAAKARAA